MAGNLKGKLVVGAIRSDTAERPVGRGKNHSRLTTPGCGNSKGPVVVEGGQSQVLNAHAQYQSAIRLGAGKVGLADEEFVTRQLRADDGPLHLGGVPAVAPAVFALEGLVIQQPRHVRGGDGCRKVLRGPRGLVEDDLLVVGLHLTPVGQGLPPVIEIVRQHAAPEVEILRRQGGIAKVIVVESNISRGQARHRCLSQGILRNQNLGLVERIVVGRQNTILGCNAGKQRFLRVGMPLAPMAQQSQLDKANARVAVIARAEGRNKGLQRLHQIFVVVVRAEPRSAASVIGRRL